MNSYLKNRKQIVTVSGKISTTQEINIGTPQGSRLSPLLFIILTVDMELWTDKSIISSFADDTQSIVISLFDLFDWKLDSEIQLWVGPCCGVQPLAQGVGVFVTPLLPHLQREAGKPVRQSQERGYWEGSYGQFNPNTT